MKKILICSSLALSVLFGDVVLDVKGSPTYSVDTEPSKAKVVESGSVIEFTGGKGTILIRDKDTNKGLAKLSKVGDDFEVPTPIRQASNTNSRIDLSEVNAATNLAPKKK